jgi:hypothetical protein
MWKLYEYICLAKYFHKNIHMLVCNKKYFYKNNKLKLYFGDRIAIVNNSIFQTWGSSRLLAELVVAQARPLCHIRATGRIWTGGSSRPFSVPPVTTDSLLLQYTFYPSPPVITNSFLQRFLQHVSDSCWAESFLRPSLGELTQLLLLLEAPKAINSSKLGMKNL